MRTRLGTNQYKIQPRKRAVLLAAPFVYLTLFSMDAVIFFIKSFRNLKNPAVYLLILTLLGSSRALAEAPKEMVALTESYQARTTYHVPELNPNIPEREQNKALIKKIWGTDSAIGLEIARCESGYKTAGAHVANTNHTVDQGVFSINSVHGMPEMENAVANISYAYIMYQEQGTAPWDSSKSCWNN